MLAPCRQRLVHPHILKARPFPKHVWRAVKSENVFQDPIDVEDEFWEEQVDEEVEVNEQPYESVAQSSASDYRMSIMEESSSNLDIASVIAALSAVVVGGVLFSRMRGKSTPTGQEGEDANSSSMGTDATPVAHGSTAAAAAALEAAFSGSSSTKSRQTGQMAAMSRTMLSFLIDELRGSSSVDFSGKNLMDEGVEYVAEGLAYNQTCKSVRFSSNAVGDKACYQLSEVLKVNVTLQDLFLDTNQIGDTAATHLASMLATNATLRRVVLAANRIADEGAAALAEMLSSNSTLLHLDLSCNEIGYNGTPPSP